MLDVSPLLAHPYCAALCNTLPEATLADLYLVGGCVRDFCHNGTVSDDWDLVTVGESALAIGKRLAKQLNGRLVHLHTDDTQPNWHIIRVVWWPNGGVNESSEANEETPPVSIDIADAFGGSLGNDLARRDLSINAMAIHLAHGEFVDPFNGQQDLATKTIRALSFENLADDPLRLLRIYRFAAQFNAASITSETQAWVSELASKLTNVAPERIQQELLKLASQRHTAQWFTGMANNGLLQKLLPEWQALPSIPPNSHHHLPLDEHTLELVHQLETSVWASLSPAWQDYLMSPIDKANPHLPNHKAVVTLGCLFHDIGKPTTHVITDEGKHTFIGHERVGETMTNAITKRLTFPKAVANPVADLVRWHLYPCAFGKTSPQKSQLRFYRRLNQWTPDLLLLAMADRLATRGPAITDQIITEAMDDLDYLLAGYPEFAKDAQTPLLLSGHAIMELLNLSPGPAVGQWANRLRDVQLLGQITTADDAKVWLLEHAQLEAANPVVAE